MPAHEFRLRGNALRQYPQLNPAIVCAATYYDAWMPCPERICLEMILDAEAENDACQALNYVSAVSAEADSVQLRDELTGEALSVRPKVVVNAAGPWIDLVNDGLGQGQRRFIGGTKGSHLVLDHPELLEAARGSEFYFENDDGRLVLILPFFDRVMIGTTDIRIDDPDAAMISEEEIDYLLAMVSKVFPAAQSRSFAYRLRLSPASGPCPTARAAERDKSAATIASGRSRQLRGGPIRFTRWSAASGRPSAPSPSKRAILFWASSVALAGQARRTCRSAAAGPTPIATMRAKPGCVICKAAVAQRCPGCGNSSSAMARAPQAVADCISRGDDSPLAHHAAYSRRELEFSLRAEKVERLDDLLLRRTLLAMRGQLSPELLDELAQICAETLGWPAARKAGEIQRCKDILRRRHRVHL